MTDQKKNRVASTFDAEFLKNFINEAAISLGFDACGFSKAGFLPHDAENMDSWLYNGFHGEMSYLERNKEKRYDPRILVEKTQTVVSVLQNYFPPELMSEIDNFKIAKYAYGADYHHVIKNKLRQLLDNITNITGPLEARVFTDSAPLLDRAWAANSGLGFIGKNTCLIHPRKGSYFFIGHLLLPIEIETRQKEVTDYCGTCTRCIDACPTQAIVSPHKLDARKCISYLTIEYKGELPKKHQHQFNDWIFGCDICQDVCPWNRFASPHNEPLFSLKPSLRTMKKNDWKKIDEEQYSQLFRDSAIERAKFEGLKRNIDFLSDA